MLQKALMRFQVYELSNSADKKHKDFSSQQQRKAIEKYGISNSESRKHSMWLFRKNTLLSLFEDILQEQDGKDNLGGRCTVIKSYTNLSVYLANKNFKKWILITIVGLVNCKGYSRIFLVRELLLWYGTANTICYFGTSVLPNKKPALREQLP